MILASLQARAVRPDHHRRRAAVLLGRRSRQESDALFRRPARRQLADRADQRSRRRQVRRRLAGAEFREHESRRIRSGPSSTTSIRRSTPKPTRYLEFERWWGGHVNLNAEEIQFIVDELFVGNNLAAGRIKTSDGDGGRSAQHPLADRGVLLQGRQHHAAAAGARTGSSISTSDVDEIRALRADHRLHGARDRRPSRNLRLRRRRQEGACASSPAIST